MAPRELLVLVLLGLGAGCSSSGPAALDAAVDAGQDLTVVDQPAHHEALVPDVTVPDFNMGEGCRDASECGKSSPLCALFDAGLKRGLCTTTCTPDNFNTPASEDSCPDGFVCGILPTSGKPTEYYCLKKCTPSMVQNPCPASSQRACNPLSSKYTQTLGQAACLYPSCRSDRDCPVESAISCSTDGPCATLGAGAFCDGSYCAKPGKCMPGGLCGPHGQGNSNAHVADPCQSDLDCPGNGYCLREEANLTGSPHYHNGYCTVPSCVFAKDVPEYACPAGSTCNRMLSAGLCEKICDLAKDGDCRGYAKDNGGDYECYGFNLIIVDGKTLAADAPVCASAPAQTCTSLGPGLDCTYLTSVANPTHMTCRDGKTGATKSNLKDPGGVCLDDTASGPFQN
jgi:hypothetical protein